MTTHNGHITYGHKRFPTTRTAGPKVEARIILRWPTDATRQDVADALDTVYQNARTDLHREFPTDTTP